MNHTLLGINHHWVTVDGPYVPRKNLFILPMGNSVPTALGEDWDLIYIEIPVPPTHWILLLQLLTNVMANVPNSLGSVEWRLWYDQHQALALGLTPTMLAEIQEQLELPNSALWVQSRFGECRLEVKAI